MTTSRAAPWSPPAGVHATRRRPALFAGLGLLALSVTVTAEPGKASLMIGAASGWALWLAGALMLAFALLNLTGGLRSAGVAASLVVTALGAWLTFHPTAGALAAGLLLAAGFVTDGAFQIAAALRLRPLSVWRWMLASAVTSLGVAVLIAAGLPERTADAVAMLGAASLATHGAALVALGLTRRAEVLPGG
jgi:uncharacterized membrane protein HdeD (DUF308 family)